MSARVLVLGSTDFTLATADAIECAGVKVGAIAYVGDTFRISYAKGGAKNFRSADIAGWCAENNAEAIHYTNIDALAKAVANDRFSLCVLAGWYHLVPGSFRRIFEHGCIGFHASLLPKLRGGAPLSWAILSDLSETGLSLFEVGDGVDDGPLYAQERIAIGSETYVSELIDETRRAADRIIQRCLPGILSGRVCARPQEGAPSYCLQRTPEDGRVDWSNSAEEINRLVRAVSRPYPGGLARLNCQEIAIHRTEVTTDIELRGTPGQIAILPGCTWPIIACGRGCIAILEAEFEDGRDALPVLRMSSNMRLA